MWSSVRWAMLVAGMVALSTFDEGRWRSSSRGDIAGCLMLVS